MGRTRPRTAAGIVLDAGALIALDRGDKRIIALLQRASDEDDTTSAVARPTVPAAPPVAPAPTPLGSDREERGSPRDSVRA